MPPNYSTAAMLNVRVSRRLAVTRPPSKSSRSCGYSLRLAHRNYTTSKAESRSDTAAAERDSTGIVHPPNTSDYVAQLSNSKLLNAGFLQPILEPFRRYHRASERNPYITQFLTALVIYGIGDLTSQYLRRPHESAQEDVSAKDGSSEEQAVIVPKWYSPVRTMRALVIGGLFAVPSYEWMMWVSTHFNYRESLRFRIPLSIATRVMINGLFFAPIFNIYFFGMQALLSGESLHGIYVRIKDALPVSWFSGLKFWPAVAVVNFAVVPIRIRPVFSGVAAVIWQAYLGILNRRAEDQQLVSGQGATA